MKSLLIKGQVSVTSVSGTYGIIREKGFIRPFRVLPGKDKEFGMLLSEQEFSQIGSAAAICINAVQAGTAGPIERASAARSFSWAFKKKERIDREVRNINSIIAGTNWSNARYDKGKFYADHNGTLIYEAGFGIEIYMGLTVCEIDPWESIKDGYVEGCITDANLYKGLNFKPIKK